MDITQEKKFSVAKKIVIRYGIMEALIIGKMRFLANNKGRYEEGKIFFNVYLEKLANDYKGLLHKTSIHRMLERLCSNDGPFVRKRTGIVYSYAFKNDADFADAGKDLLYFDYKHAVEYGVVGAILINNLQHWVLKNRESDEAYSWHAMSPYTMEKVLGVSRRTVSDALKSLCRKGVLSQRPIEGPGRCREFSFNDEVAFLTKRAKEMPKRANRIEKLEAYFADISERYQAKTQPIEQVETQLEQVEMQPEQAETQPLYILESIEKKCVQDKGPRLAAQPTHYLTN